ncbi:hypothetical protein PTT_05685, partial [Pyrenophora teres f. teres 0-1]
MKKPPKPSQNPPQQAPPPPPPHPTASPAPTHTPRAYASHPAISASRDSTP